MNNVPIQNISQYSCGSPGSTQTVITGKQKCKLHTVKPFLLFLGLSIHSAKAIKKSSCLLLYIPDHLMMNRVSSDSINYMMNCCDNKAQRAQMAQKVTRWYTGANSNVPCAISPSIILHLIQNMSELWMVRTTRKLESILVLISKVTTLQVSGDLPLDSASAGCLCVPTSHRPCMYYSSVSSMSCVTLTWQKGTRPFQSETHSAAWTRKHPHAFSWAPTAWHGIGKVQEWVLTIIPDDSMSAK